MPDLVKSQVMKARRAAKKGHKTARRQARRDAAAAIVAAEVEVESCRSVLHEAKAMKGDVAVQSAGIATAQGWLVDSEQKLDAARKHAASFAPGKSR